MGKPLVCVLLAMTACGGSDPRVDGPTPDVLNTPGQPGVGAHELAFYRLFETQRTTLATPAMTTAQTGSTIIASIGRGKFSAHQAPTDNKGNTATQLEEAHTYVRWADSGTAVYAFKGMTGGSNHVVSAATPEEDELTLAAVEVVSSGREEPIAAWKEVIDVSNTHQSASVTTKGPATLVAFWWGDANEAGEKNAEPIDGFARIRSVFASGALVQCAVAVKNVTEPGTYSVTWTKIEPEQGAQLWLVAVQ